jgi:hypothetical protein
METIKRWQKGDNTAYQHYLRKFSALVQAEGEGFQREVAHFKHVIANLTRFCSDVREVTKEMMPKNFSQQLLGPNDSVMLLSHNEITALKEKEDPHVLGRKELKVEKSEFNEECSVSEDDCRLLKMAETPFHQLLVYKTKQKRTALGYVEKRKKKPVWNPDC